MRNARHDPLQVRRIEISRADAVLLVSRIGICALLALSWGNSFFGHVTTLRPLLRSHLGDSGRAGTTMQTAKATMAEVANVSTLQECSSHASNESRHAPRQLPKPA